MKYLKFKKEDLIKSPLNYTGGKFKLLPQILPLFPDKINKFIDLFCGGCNVGINSNAGEVHCNDNMKQLIDLYTEWQKHDIDYILEYINGKINEFQLSKTNKDGYLKFRKYYNKYRNSLDLYILISHSFNNQIRFNKKGEFNLPFGDRFFSESLKNNLIDFFKVIKNIKFTNNSFEYLNIKILTHNDLVYLDPPYLITCASYNEIGGWNETHEMRLLKFLDDLNDQNVKFALSNVLESKGKSNDILKNWSKKYNVNYLQSNYDNCSYYKNERKENKNSTVEVLITNY